ncbi:MAG: sulfatase-like hydrolase/transferase [Verrucomicrobia bacterium]|nr:sulfatase-like hydrolase/transferase [Verrucomicrobiota bacterium]
MPENPIQNHGTRAIGCLWFLIWCSLAGASPAQTTLIDATFDGVSNDTNPNFQIISNTLADGSGASWNQSTGYVNRGTATNSTAGAVSVTTLDIAALGSDSLVLTAEVQAASGPLSSNGLFIGFQEADGGAGALNELWNNLGPSFGLVIDGGSRGGPYVVAPGGFGTAAFQRSSAFGTTTQSSVNDGFKVVMTINSSGWNFEITGLQTSAATAITGGSGTWASVPFSFSNFTSGMRVAFTTQGNGGGSLDLTGIKVVRSSAPVPPDTGPQFPFVDTDGDGYGNQAEIAFGSDPANPSSMPDHTPAPARPNIVIIYADDMGLGDMSAYGNLFGTASPAVTPRMDGLASQGVMFTQAHSSNAVCSPSRYAMLTGKYNWREFDDITSHYGVGPIPQIPKPGDVTIAEFLKTHAYDTAAFGKWHLGGAWYQRNSNTRITGNPTDPTTVDWARPIEGHAVANGFDIFRGLACSINFAPYVYLDNDRAQYWDSSLNGGTGGYRNATNSDSFHYFTTSELNSTVVGNKDSRAGLGDPSYRQVDADPKTIGDVEAYLSQRAASGDSDPFFAYVALCSPHLPWALTAPFIGADSASGFYYADWMREVDHRIGRLIDAVDRNGFHDNTIIIFTSDNGPEKTAMSQSLARGKDPNGPLRGNKRDVWEGGTRVPFVVRWPGQAAAGLKVGDPVWQGDIFATLAAFLGDELPATTAPDGESFLNLIRGQRKPGHSRDSIIVSSIRGDLGLKTTDGWKFIDSTGGGGDSSSWDSANRPISNPAGTDQGVPKQLFRLATDLGENTNLIASQTSTSQIRSQLTLQTGKDLLTSLDQYRTTTTAVLFPRRPDNDGDGMTNSFETQFGLNRDSPQDAAADPDGDDQTNLEEFITGTDPTSPLSRFRVIEANHTVTGYQVSWHSVTGRTYKVHWTTDLAVWHPYSVKSGTGGMLSETLDKAAMDAADGVVGNLSRCFVRVSAAED